MVSSFALVAMKSNWVVTYIKKNKIKENNQELDPGAIFSFYHLWRKQDCKEQQQKEHRITYTLPEIRLQLEANLQLGGSLRDGALLAIVSQDITEINAIAVNNTVEVLAPDAELGTLGDGGREGTGGGEAVVLAETHGRRAQGKGADSQIRGLAGGAVGELGVGAGLGRDGRNGGEGDGGED